MRILLKKKSGIGRSAASGQRRRREGCGSASVQQMRVGSGSAVQRIGLALALLAGAAFVSAAALVLAGLLAAASCCC